MGWVDPFGLATCATKLDRMRRHTSSSQHYPKHIQAKTRAEAMNISKNGKKPPAQYWGDELGESATSAQVNAYRNRIEKEGLRNGYEIDLGNKGSNYYIYDAGRTIGYNNGKATQHMRIEVNSLNEFHGHPISLEDYNQYLKKVIK